MYLETHQQMSFYHGSMVFTFWYQQSSQIAAVVVVICKWCSWYKCLPLQIKLIVYCGIIMPQDIYIYLVDKSFFWYDNITNINIKNLVANPSSSGLVNHSYVDGSISWSIYVIMMASTIYSVICTVWYQTWGF